MLSLRKISNSLRDRMLNRWLSGTRRRPHGKAPFAQLPETLEVRKVLSATPAGTEFLVNSDPEAFLAGGDVDRAPNGASVAVWSEDDQLFAQRYDAAGATVGDVIVVQDSGGIIGSPAVAIADDGQFVVAWVEDDEFILGRRFDADGEELDDDPLEIAEVTVDDEGSIAFVDVDMDADGDFVVAWTVGPSRIPVFTEYASDDSELFARRYTKAGTPAEAQFRVDSPTNDDVYLISNPKVAMDADGDFIVGWTVGRLNYETIVVKYRYYGYTYEYEYEVLILSGSDIKVRRYDTTSFAQPATAAAIQNVATAIKLGTVVNLQDLDIDTDGDFAVAYTLDTYKEVTERYYGYSYHYMRQTASELLVQRFDADGDPVKKKPKALVKMKGQEQIALASVALDNDGEFSLAWGTKIKADQYIYSYGAPLPGQGRSNTPRGYSGYDDYGPVKVYAQHFLAKGKADGAAVQLKTNNEALLLTLSAANRDNGELLVLWTFGMETETELRGRRVTV